MADEGSNLLATIIREDGSFDLTRTMLRILGPGMERLRNTGDRISVESFAGSWSGDIEVIRSRYTVNSSRMTLRFLPPSEIATITYEAKRRPDGLIDYRKVTQSTLYEAVVDATLKRFEGELPWEQRVPSTSENPGNLVRYLKGHEQCISSVAFSPNGKYLLSGGYDRAIRLWDVETGEQVRRFEGHKEAVRSVSFSPDGRFAVSAGNTTFVDHGAGGGRTNEKDSSSLVHRYLVDHTRSIGLVALGEFIRIWDVETGRETRRFKVPNTIHAAIFSPDGRFIAAGGRGKFVDWRDSYENAWIWEVETGRLVQRLHHRATVVKSLAFSPGGQYLVCLTEMHWPDPVIVVWDVETGRERLEIGPELKDFVSHICISRDGRRLLTSGDSSILEWDLTTGDLIHRIKDDSIEPPAIYDHAGHHVLVPFRAGHEKGMKLIRLDTKETVEKFVDRNDSGMCVAIALSPDGRLVACGDGRAIIRLWQMPE